MYVSRGMYISTRKMKKKIISLLLGCVMVMSLVACGDLDGGNSKDSSNDNQAESTESDEVDESQEDDKPIKVLDMKTSYSYFEGETDDGSRTVTTYVYNEYFDVVEESEGTSKIIYEYNDNRDVISISDDTIGWSYEYQYDNNGNCINEKEYNSDNELIYEYNNKYDASGNIISKEEIEYYDTENGSSTYCAYYEYEYDNNDNLIKMTRTQPSLAWVEYEYDKNDNLIIEKTYGYNEEGSIQKGSYCEYEYVDNNLVKKVDYCGGEDGNYSVDSYTEYEYDSEGYLIKETHYADTRYHVTEYKYISVE